MQALFHPIKIIFLDQKVNIFFFTWILKNSYSIQNLKFNPFRISYQKLNIWQDEVF